MDTPDLSGKVNIAKAKQAWKQMDLFLQQQFTAAQVARRTQKELENRIYGLETQLEKQQADKKSEANLEEKIKQLEQEHKEGIQGLMEVKQRYEIQISQKEQTDTMVAEWLKKIKEVYTSELDNLASKNAELMTNKKVLMQQVSALRKIKDKLKSLQDEDDELNLDDVFISSESMETIKEDILQTGNLIWEGIKGRISGVLMKPWEAVAKKEHKEHISMMQEQLDRYIKDNQNLQEKVNVLENDKTSRASFHTEARYLSPIQEKSFDNLICDIGQQTSKLESDNPDVQKKNTTLLTNDFVLQNL